MAKNRQYYIRKAHRYLGVFLGIQFLLWTAGGLYFSWNDIDEVHGDLHRKAPALLPADLKLAPPDSVLNDLRELQGLSHVASFQLIPLLGHPVYQVKLAAPAKAKGTIEEITATKNYLLDARTGRLRAPLAKNEAIDVAREAFLEPASIKEVKYITETDKHHEYRNNPLPAYAIFFEHPSHTTVYVSTELGTVQKFRNQKWRAFDFLWMLHTMDYEGRDDFGNILLRICAILGLLTVLSGFLLFAFTQRIFKR